MGAGCKGGGGESGGGGGGCRERWEPNKSSKERCFCLMSLENSRRPLVEGGEGCGEVLLGGGGWGLGLTAGGGGTHRLCKWKKSQM